MSHVQKEKSMSCYPKVCQTSPEGGAGKTRRRLGGSPERCEPWGTEEFASSQQRLSSHADKPRFRKVTVLTV